MLTLNRKTEYALVSLCYLEQQRQAGEPLVSAQKIAEAFNLPLPLLMNILKQLRRAGFVSSTRGATGGYALDRDANQIVLLEVLEVMEGPMQLTPCTVDPQKLADAGIEPEHGEDGCGLLGYCPVHQAISRLHNRIENFLRDVSLADLVHSSVDVPVNAVGRMLKIQQEQLVS
ncbi:MAG TPA: Rrf2 family transcriptional regulator [Phycisphaerales bacterium]|nr:Rrf2 family transcriptional regulator [Phycisphaerales bacterium]HCD34602.1 Rrf2 family transcriptional regulator [Phycisphaerales bacterium]|tara:strand:+ start:368 stop:886 length:519 start_codon:yes stop_codon:yes gene_type:complete